jgi:alpha-beta hydrolase superfamily lysophospholipase
MSRIVQYSALNILAIGAILAAAVTFGASPAVADEPFYAPAAREIPGAPGTLIRQEPVVFPPQGAKAYRILYRSIGIHGEPIAVSGLLIVPTRRQQGPMPIVAWAHPTTGVAQPCAPSMARLKFLEIPGLRDFLQSGYAVVATDYPGLGVKGSVHPYLNGQSEGRAVLDSARVAAAILGEPKPKVLLWGHSQGGQAVLFAAALSSSYAPELHIAGVAAAAPATDLEALLRDDLATPGGKNILAMTLWSWSQLYNTSMDKIVDPRAIADVQTLAAACLESPLDLPLRNEIGQRLQERFLLVSDPTKLEPWRELIEQNHAPTAIGRAPLFIVQGQADTVVNPAVTAQYAAALSRQGAWVEYASLPGVEHGGVAEKSAASVAAWFDRVLAGEGGSKGQ